MTAPWHGASAPGSAETVDPSDGGVGGADATLTGAKWLVPPSGPGTPPTKVHFNQWDGSSWVALEASPKIWDGSAWVEYFPQFFNGSSWEYLQ